MALLEPTEYRLQLGLSRNLRVFSYPWRVSRFCGIAKAEHDLDRSPRYHLFDGLAMTYRVDQGLTTGLFRRRQVLARVNPDY